MNWGKIYYDHFAKFFGQPVASISIEIPHKLPVYILSYDLGHNRYVYCTLGMNRYVPKAQNVYEIFMVANQSTEQVLRLFSLTAGHIADKDIFVKHGLDVGGIEVVDVDFSKNYQKSAFYFFYPFELPEGFDIIHVEEGGTIYHGSVYEAMLISQQEREYLQREGSAKLEDLFAEHQVIAPDINRPSVV